MNIHICLISNQLLANYIPILMLKPDHVCLISTESMKRSRMTQRFEKMLDAKKIPYETYENMPSVNMPQIHEYALEVIDKIQTKHPNASLILNITGGTKLMSQGFSDIMMAEDAQFIYTDTQHNNLEYLPASDKKAPDPLKSVLKIADYLQANGANYKQALSEKQDWLQTINQRKKITKEIAQQAEPLAAFLGAINRVANEAFSTGTLTQKLNNSPRGLWRTMLQRYHDAGLIDWQGDTQITFKTDDAARYLGGVWLEEYVYHIAADAKPDDVQSSVKISWEKSKSTHNELDVLLVHNNRMLVIECKTMRFGREGNEQKDADVLYKIDSLGDTLKGLYGEMWLVSAREPNNEMLDRAKDRHITIIAPHELKTLRNKIQQWMSKK